MNIQEYKVAARRTVRESDDTKIEFSLGVCGESGEIIDYIKKVHFQGEIFNKEHIKEELGDLLWYITNLATECDLDIISIIDTMKLFNEMITVERYSEITLAFNISWNVGKLVLAVQNESKLDVESSIKKLILYSLKLSDMYNLTFDEIFEFNIKKLQKRYPNGFSEELSRNR